MILTDEILETIVDAINESPDAPITLPDHAYGANGRVIVLVDGLPVDLHRHLHDLLIRPLSIHEIMHNVAGVPGNVNPHLFVVTEGRRSIATHCRKGHKYAGNEAPPNSRGYRCKTCYLDSLPESKGVSNRDKTHCPANHPYDEKNTKVIGGRRRCIICDRKKKRDYARRVRAQRKEASQ